MDMEDIKLKARQAREREYHDFLALYRDYRDILNPPQTPATADATSAELVPERERRINDLYRRVYASPYIRRFDRSALNAAFKQLEALLAASPGAPISLDELGQKFRQVCFLHRFALIIKWEHYERRPPNPEALGQARKRIALQCQKLEGLLIDQLEDEPLLRELHNADLTALLELIKDLDQIGKVFKTITPRLPYVRNRDADNSVMRLFLYDLAECCYRIYEACDHGAMLKLLQSCRLRAYTGVRKSELEALIENALNIKITDYLARIAERDDDVNTPEPPWMPVRSL